MDISEVTTRWVLFGVSMIFGVFGSLWHIPLSLIKGYYQSKVIQTVLLLIFSTVLVIKERDFFFRKDYPIC